MKIYNNIKQMITIYFPLTYFVLALNYRQTCSYLLLSTNQTLCSIPHGASISFPLCNNLMSQVLFCLSQSLLSFKMRKLAYRVSKLATSSCHYEFELGFELWIYLTSEHILLPVHQVLVSTLKLHTLFISLPIFFSINQKRYPWHLEEKLLRVADKDGNVTEDLGSNLYFYF